MKLISSSDNPSPELLAAKINSLERYQDAMMAVCAAEKTALHRLNNSIVPLHLLPTEIFTAILALVIDHRVKDGDREPLKLHRLAQVCRRWRDIVLDCPVFWKVLSSEFEADFLKWTLQRNPNGQLRIFYAPLSSAVDSFWTEVVPQTVQRWQKLVYETHDDQSTSNLLQALGKSTPQLTGIFVNLRFFVDPSERRSRQLELVDGATLQYLSLGNAAIPWESSRLTNLRAIDLWHIAQCLPSPARLHAILSSSPQLWYLSLTDLVDLTTTSVSKHPTPTTEVHLPCLTTLILYDIPISIIRLLLSTVSAPVCDFFIINNLEVEDLQKHQPHLNALSTRSLGTRPAVRFTSFQQDMQIGLLSLSSEPPPKLPTQWPYYVTEEIGLQVTFKVRMANFDDISNVITWVSAVTSLFGLPEELVLSYDLWSPPMDLFLQSHSVGQSSVTNLHLRSSSPSNYVPCFLTRRSINADGIDGPDGEWVEARFPRLKTLNLEVGHALLQASSEVKRFLGSRAKSLSLPPASGSSSSVDNCRLMIKVPEISVNQVAFYLEGLQCDVEASAIDY
ncbi:hypothetical protein FRB90_002827 [Tulasnella sp. 427]|nr:hypothetical protein FRB90_002827 [Tulasnella sp. 427]